jgi:BolA family transcriptional regulator, general stress-responsive regulator
MGAASAAYKELTDVKSADSPNASRKADSASRPALSRQQRLAKALNASFSPEALEIVDESAAHAGHAGASAGGQTHYRVRMTAAAFTGLNRVARQRAVNQAVKTEFDSGLHALALELKAPGE